MITVTIRQAAKKFKKLENAHQLQIAAQLRPAVAADLWKGEKIPKLETLDKLCKVLGCELWDLIKRRAR